MAGRARRAPHPATAGHNSEENQRRIVANRSRQARQKAKKYKEDMETLLSHITQEVEMLKNDKDKKVRDIARLETLLSLHRRRSSRQQQQQQQYPEPISAAGGSVLAISAGTSTGLLSDTMLDVPGTSSTMEQSAGTYSISGSNQQRASLPSTLLPGVEVTRESKRRTSKKMCVYLYEQPPQDDPEKERKRLRAARAYKNRQNATNFIKQLRDKLEACKEQVECLKKEKGKVEKHLKDLQKQCDQLKIGETCADKDRDNT